MLMKYWNRIVNMHITKEMNKLDIIQARIVNQIVFLKGTFFIVDSIRDWAFGLISNVFVLFSFGCLILSSFFFPKARFNPYVLFTACLIVSILIFYYSSKDGFDNGITFYYFSQLTIVLLLLNRKSLIITFYLIILTLFSISHMYDFNLIKSDLIVTEPLIKTVRIITFIQAFMLLSMAGYFIVFKHNELVRLYQQVIRSGTIISDLRKRLNDHQKVNIEDIVKLAIENDLAFIPLFKQNFPNFYDNLKAFNTQMTGEEFKFCALLKLGFTTKDIAEYNHYTVRTVQTKKNRLRKSFNIPSEKDLYVWIDDI